MATRLLGSIQTGQYNGQPVALPTAVCTPSTQKPAQVAIQIDWLVYWQQFNQPSACGVEIDLQGITPNAKTLDGIRSLKIDNTFSVCPVYAVFPDTGDVITCPPQTVVTMPVNTNAQKCTFYATGLQDGFLPFTRAYFFNVAMPPSVDPAIQVTFPQWKGSPTVQRNSTQILTPGYGAPALGDNTDSFNFGNVSVSGLLVPSAQYQFNLFRTPYTEGFIYLTHIDFSVFLEYYSGVGSGGGTLVLGSTGAAGQLYVFSLTSNRTAAGAPGPGFPEATRNSLIRLSGMNLKLDATQTWQIYAADFIGGYTCNMSLSLNWTYNPT